MNLVKWPTVANIYVEPIIPKDYASNLGRAFYDNNKILRGVDEYLRGNVY